MQSNWADGQGKDVYVRNYYSTKALFDKLPGVCGVGTAAGATNLAGSACSTAVYASCLPPKPSCAIQ